MNSSINKKKIINDPVFGFINLQSEIIFDLIEHPYFQRLRRIKQLGLSCLVFPGGNHTRFEHAIGSIHLMRQAISVLRNKGIEITEKEAEAVTIAILLHDIGHAPFSHVLENSLIGISHETISLFLMEELNNQFNGKLSLGIQIFKNQYRKNFLHQLVSSQLDMDRLDYLCRDSFFTGVTEGLIGIDRIIKMLNVWNDQLVVEIKGIYSIEKFLIARRLMYWQVYLHKTVVSAEYLLINILKRARNIAKEGNNIFAPPSLQAFLNDQFTGDDYFVMNTVNRKNLLETFVSLDDNDIVFSVKEWQNHPDKILSFLSKSLINRNLFKTIMREKPFSQKYADKYYLKIQQKFNVNKKDASYYFTQGELTNNAYSKGHEDIKILYKSGQVKNIQDASDINLSALSKTVRKFFLCYPKELDF